MSVLALLSPNDQQEAQTIDASGYRDTAHPYDRFSQADPYDKIATASLLPDITIPPLPDPTVGGRPAPGNVNGATGGPGPWNQTHAGVANYAPPLPAIDNSPQGNVGRRNTATRTFLGVQDQLAGYPNPSILSAASFVNIPIEITNNG